MISAATTKSVSTQPNVEKSLSAMISHSWTRKHLRKRLLYSQNGIVRKNSTHIQNADISDEHNP